MRSSDVTAALDHLHDLTTQLRRLRVEHPTSLITAQAYRCSESLQAAERDLHDLRRRLDATEHHPTQREATRGGLDWIGRPLE